MSLLRHLLLLTLTLTTAACATEARACGALAKLADGQQDASEALADCLQRVPAGGRLELPFGVYRLQRPLTLVRSVTLATTGTAPGSSACDPTRSQCATLLLDPRGKLEAGGMPITVASDGVTFDRLILRGVESTGRLRGPCTRSDERSNGGGVRIAGVSRFTLTRSVLRDFTCYTAMEVTAGARDLRVADNVFGPNGDHRPGELWSDGLTIHDAIRASVLHNRFFDNTDVQLVLGGCVDCRIERNDFSHGGTFRRAAFAELMLHAWPNTSGNFQGSLVSSNQINCGDRRQCGFGIMIGSAPWYPGRAEGGTISGNLVSNAEVGINVDALTGPMEIRGNQVRASGGRYRSSCGERTWPAVNVSPGSMRHLKGEPADLPHASMDTRGCLLAREPAQPARLGA